MINFENNYLLDENNLKAFASALKSGKCPQGLILNLKSSIVGDEGAKILAHTLGSGQCPPGLVLNLTHTYISNEGIKAFAGALSSGFSPRRLTLNLKANLIGKGAEKMLARALESEFLPEGLKLHFGEPLYCTGSYEMLNRVWQRYHRENVLRCFVLQQGKRQLDHPLNKLPQEILNEIYSYLSPTNIPLKMLKISARAFLNLLVQHEKQSHVNDLNQMLKNLYSAKQEDKTNILGEFIDNLPASIRLQQESLLPAVNNFKKNLEMSLSKKKIEDKEIRAAIDTFLKAEFGEMKEGQSKQSAITSTLLRFHLISGENAYKLRRQELPDHFSMLTR